MAFPVVAATNTSSATGVTDHTVNLPTGIVSGNLLVVLFTSDESPTITWPGGWTQLYQDSVAGQVASSVAFRRADGGEGASITVQTDTLQSSTALSYRITGHHTTTDPEAGTAATGNSTNPNPPTLNPVGWDVEDTLWLTFAGWDEGSTTSDITVYPTNYTNGFASEVESAVYGSSASARRELAAASDDPGTFGLSDGTEWVAGTVAIRPAAAASGQSSRSMHQYRIRRAA